MDMRNKAYDGFEINAGKLEETGGLLLNTEYNAASVISKYLFANNLISFVDTNNKLSFSDIIENKYNNEEQFAKIVKEMFQSTVSELTTDIFTPLVWFNFQLRAIKKVKSHIAQIDSLGADIVTEQIKDTEKNLIKAVKDLNKKHKIVSSKELDLVLKNINNVKISLKFDIDNIKSEDDDILEIT